MINNIYKKIIKFFFKYKTKIILIFFVPQLFVASYNFFSIEKGCLLFADYKISNIILDKGSVNEMYLQLLTNDLPNLKVLNNQFLIENKNSDTCKKVLNIKEINHKSLYNSKLIYINFLFSIILNILFFLKKNIKLSKYF